MAVTILALSLSGPAHFRFKGCWWNFVLFLLKVGYKILSADSGDLDQIPRLVDLQ